MEQKHKTAFTDLCATFNAAVIQQWEQVVTTWEKDPANSEVDPFEEQHTSKYDREPRTAVSDHQLQLQI